MDERVKADTTGPQGQEYIDVVFDGPPGPVSGRFIEVEDQRGYSVRAGEWMEWIDGLWTLRLPEGTP